MAQASTSHFGLAAATTRGGATGTGAGTATGAAGNGLTGGLGLGAATGPAITLGGSGGGGGANTTFLASGIGGMGADIQSSPKTTLPAATSTTAE